MKTDEGKNRVALVTGGSRGIGKAISLRIAGTVARTVIVNYLQNETEAERTRIQIEELQCRCVLARANLADPQEIDRLFAIITKNTESIDIFVHCAALNTFKSLLEVKPNQWDLTMNTNARGFLLCVQKTVPLMKGGSIVAISSLGSGRVVPNYGAMGPTKAALESIVRYLAFELAPRGIRVNAVSGGYIKTESIMKFPNAGALREEARKNTPGKRLGTPDDIADVVMFLINPDSRWIYGQTVVVDGGVTLM